MSNKVTISATEWVQIKPVSASAYAVVSEVPINAGVTPPRVKWAKASTKPAVSEEAFSFAGPGDQINGSSSLITWAISCGEGDASVVIHHG